MKCLALGTLGFVNDTFWYLPEFYFAPESKLFPFKQERTQQLLALIRMAGVIKVTN